MHQAKRPIALATRGLTKCFDRPAVDALDLTVDCGEFYALVGPNGAGTTTTLRMLVGLLRPAAGTIALEGIDALAHPVAAKQTTAWRPDGGSDRRYRAGAVAPGRHARRAESGAGEDRH